VNYETDPFVPVDPVDPVEPERALMPGFNFASAVLATGAILMTF